MNVKTAAIFHANDAMFLLTSNTIKVDEPSQTKLVEDILVKEAGHSSITRDPRIEDLVLCIVEALGSAPGQMSNCLSQSELKREAPATNPPPDGRETLNPIDRANENEPCLGRNPIRSAVGEVDFMFHKVKISAIHRSFFWVSYAESWRIYLQIVSLAS